MYSASTIKNGVLESQVAHTATSLVQNYMQDKVFIESPSLVSLASSGG